MLVMLVLTLCSIFLTSSCYMFNGFEIRDLQHNDSSFLEEIAQWNSSGIVVGSSNYSICQGTYFLGGYNILQFDGSFSRTYLNLPQHNVVYYSITLEVLDLWSEDDAAMILIDNIGQSFQGASENNSQNMCGNPLYPDFGLVRLEGRVFHQKSTLTFSVFSQILTSSDLASFGFRDINLVFRNESDSSLRTSFFCAEERLLLFSQCSCSEGEYLFNGICSLCDPSCETCFGPSELQCSKCPAGHYFDGEGCIICDTKCSICNGITNDMCNACTTGNYLVLDHKCIDQCNSPFIKTISNSVWTCEYPCLQNEILYTNDTCLPLSSCPSASLQSDVDTGFDICEPVCSNQVEFMYTNGSCLSDCPEPLQQGSENNFRFCDPPLCEGQKCSTCQKDTDCPTKYYCDENIGYCQIMSSFRLQSYLISTFLNGYVLTVQVMPIPTSDENVQETLFTSFISSTLLPNIITTVKKISSGSFVVYIEITSSWESDTLLANFTYISQNTELNITQELPKLIYVSPELQTAATVVHTATYISALILTLSMLNLFLIGEFSSIWTAFPENQFSYYLLFLNIDYLHHTKLFFEGLANFDLLFLSGNLDTGENEANIDVKRSLPAKFLDKGYNYNFFGNIGPLILMMMAIATALFLISFLLTCLRFPSKLKRVYNLFKIIQDSLKWNAIMNHSISYTLPMALASMVQFHRNIMGKNQSISAFICAAVLMVGLLISLRKVFRTIKRMPKSKFERVIYTQRYGVLWDGLLTDPKTIFFYWAITWRGFLLTYLVVVFDLYPNIQLISIILYQCYIISLYFSKWKFQSIYRNSFLNTVSLIEEISILLMELMITAFLNVTDMGDRFSIFLGWLIIFPGIVGQFSRVLILTVMQIKERKKIYLKMKISLNRLCKKRYMRRIKKIQPYPLTAI